MFVFATTGGALAQNSAGPLQGSCAQVADAFLQGGVGSNNRYFDFLAVCGDRPSLDKLLTALTNHTSSRRPVEIAAGIEAVLSAPAMKKNSEATDALAAAMPSIADPGVRIGMTRIFAERGNVGPLLAMLKSDRDPQVRAAAADALAASDASFDPATLFAAGRGDRDPNVRARAWVALRALNQLHSPSELREALNAQDEVVETVRMFEAWVRAESTPSATIWADRLLAMAQSGTVNEATGALATIAALLDPRQAAGDDASATMSLALAPKRTEIKRAALARFAQFVAHHDDGARVAFAAVAAASGCAEDGDADGSRGCGATPEILAATDRLPGPSAAKASAMLAGIARTDYVAYRRRQYLVALAAIAALLVAAGIVAARWFRGRVYATTFAIAIPLAIGAALQFFAAGGAPIAWPPLKLWPAGFVGDVTLTTMLAVLASLALPPGRWRQLTAMLVAEAAWWILPIAFTAAGVPLAIAEYAGSNAATVVAPIAGAAAAPLAAWACAGFVTVLSGTPLSAPNPAA